MDIGNKIIQSGLVFYIDPLNPKSYSGITSGTVSIVKNIVNGVPNSTLINGTGFDGKSFVFDGVNDYINCNNSSLTLLSVDFWYKGIQNVVTGTYNGLVVKQNAWGVFMSNNTLQLYNWSTSSAINTNINISDNTWRNITVTFDEMTGTPLNNVRIYVNSILVLISTVKILNMTPNVLIGYGNSTNQFAKGNISSVKIYSKVLSQSEISQNFNATKGRYL